MSEKNPCNARCDDYQIRAGTPNRFSVGYLTFRYVISPLVTKLNDAVQDAHHTIVRKSTKGEWPF